MSKERDVSCLMTHPIHQVRLGKDLRPFSILKTAPTPFVNFGVYPTPVLHSVIKTTEGGAERPETGPSTLLMWRTSQTTISCTIIMAQKSFFP